MLTKIQLADKYNVSKSTVDKWLKQGIPVLRLGYRTLRFEAEVVDMWLKDRQRVV